MHWTNKSASQGNLTSSLSCPPTSSHCYPVAETPHNCHLRLQIVYYFSVDRLLTCRLTKSLISHSSIYEQPCMWSKQQISQGESHFFHFAPPYSKQTYFHLSHNLAAYTSALPQEPCSVTDIRPVLNETEKGRGSAYLKSLQHLWFSFPSTWVESIFHAGLFFGLPTESALWKVHRNYQCLKTRE